MLGKGVQRLALFMLDSILRKLAIADRTLPPAINRILTMPRVFSTPVTLITCDTPRRHMMGCFETTCRHQHRCRASTQPKGPCIRMTRLRITSYNWNLETSRLCRGYQICYIHRHQYPPDVWVHRLSLARRRLQPAMVTSCVHQQDFNL